MAENPHSKKKNLNMIGFKLPLYMAADKLRENPHATIAA